MFTESFPIVTTPDLTRALGFYRDVLGGTVSFERSDADGTPVYLEVGFGSSRVGLALDAGDAGGGSSRQVSIYMRAVDCDAAVERLRANGVEVVRESMDRPAQERVARARDPDGNELIIGQRAAGQGRRVDDIGAKLMSPEPTAYLRVEYERRFLISPNAPWRDFVEPYWKTFEDYYLRQSRLRLRTLTDSDTGLEFIKLTKKLESSSPYFQSIGSIPLAPFEYDFLESLEGDRLTKRRYYHFHGGLVFSIDVFLDELSGLVLCEVETGGIEELMQIEPPDYAMAEVTEDPFFTGGSLCRTSRDELARKLAEMGIPLT